MTFIITRVIYSNTSRKNQYETHMVFESGLAEALLKLKEERKKEKDAAFYLSLVIDQ